MKKNKGHSRTQEIALEWVAGAKASLQSLFKEQESSRGGKERRRSRRQRAKKKALRVINGQHERSK